MEEVRPEFLPQVADWVAEWFPNLEGRAVAVTDGDITKENRPTLPFSLVAMNREDTTPSANSRSGDGNLTIVQDFIVEMWLPVKRFSINPGTLKPGVEAPFWAYYPSDAIRDKLVSRMYRAFTLEANRSLGTIAYTSLDIAADPQAVVLTFRFSRTYIWCPLDDPEDEEIPFTISYQACPTSC